MKMFISPDSHFDFQSGKGQESSALHTPRDIQSAIMATADYHTKSKIRLKTKNILNHSLAILNFLLILYSIFGTQIALTSAQVTNYPGNRQSLTTQEDLYIKYAKQSKLYNQDGSCGKGSCYPATGDLLIGRENQLSATSTCGLDHSSRYCIVSHLEDEKKCFYCDSKNPYHPLYSPNSHRIQNVISSAKTDTDKRWWQAENGVEKVSIRLDMEAEFHFTHLIMIFKTFRPAAMLVEKSSDFGKTWTVVRYYAYDCETSFPGVKLGPLKTVSDIVCITRYSYVAPSTHGEVIHRARPPYIELTNPYDRDVQQLLKMTNLRINFTKLHTLGDNLLDNREEVREKYYYALLEMVVRGSCSCYGHASRCIPLPGQARVPNMVYGRCECNHHTKGLNCEQCEDFYNDVPWRPAHGKRTNACKRCQCNEHATRCHFDPVIFGLSGNVSGGVCDDCTHNTQGRACEQCKPGFYRVPGLPLNHTGICAECQCDKRGSLNDGQCDSASLTDPTIQPGACHCKRHVHGKNCDTCKDGYWNLDASNPEGCEACSCLIIGTEGNLGCDKKTGKCRCKAHVTGENCDVCKPGFYGLSRENVAGCEPCDCDIGGSLSPHCDARRAGQCTCKAGVRGRRCDASPPGTYCAELDLATFEAEDIAPETLDAKFTTIIQRERPLNTLFKQAQQQAINDTNSVFSPDNNVNNESGNSENDEVLLSNIVTWTGDGFVRVREGGTLKFHVNNIRALPMTYQLVIRYELPMDSDWQEVIITMEEGYNSDDDNNHQSPSSPYHYGTQNHHQQSSRGTPSSDTNSVCAKFSQPLVQVGYLRHTVKYSVVALPYCLSGGLPQAYTFTLDFTHYGREPTPQAYVLIDSIAFVPMLESIPLFSGSTMFSSASARKANNLNDSTDANSNYLAFSYGQTFNNDVVYAANNNNGNNPNNYNQFSSVAFDFAPGLQALRRDYEAFRCRDAYITIADPAVRDKHQPEPCKKYRCTLALSMYSRPMVCDCDPTGSLSSECRVEGGACQCKPGVIGRRCDKCAPGTYGFGPSGCKACNCDGRGSLDTVCDRQTGQCKCIPGVIGQACDFCQPGTWNFPSCIPCQCNGHADRCDALTGDCSVLALGGCRDNTDGPNCETCAPYFYGDPRIEVNIPCRPCNCPGGRSRNQFAASCYLDPSTRDMVCRCKPGYVGKQCEKCADNFFGRPLVPGGTCQPCQCNGNVLPNQLSGICHAETGECLKCAYHTRGFNCEQCVPGFFGNALQRNCLSCVCNALGTNPLMTAAANTADLGQPEMAYYLEGSRNQDWIDDRGDDDIYEANYIRGRSDQVITPETNVLTPAQQDLNYVMDQAYSPYHMQDGFYNFNDHGDKQQIQFQMNPILTDGNAPTPINTNNFVNRDLINPNYEEMSSIIQYQRQANTISQSGPTSYLTRRNISSSMIPTSNQPQYANYQQYYTTRSRQQEEPTFAKLMLPVYVCDSVTGQCPCLPNVTGLACDTCAPNHWNLASGRGCEPCSCCLASSLSGPQCNQMSGQCTCKPGFGGRTCCDCEDNHWGDPNVKCYQCSCDSRGSTSYQCDRKTGRCACRPGITGIKCDMCARGTIGQVPACRECGQCFNDWDTAIQQLLTETNSLAEKAAQIKDTGIASNYAESFKRLNNKIKAIDDTLRRANLTTQDLNTISNQIEDLRKKLSQRSDDLENLIEIHANVNKRITDSMAKLADIQSATLILRNQTKALEENTTRLQEADLEGAFTIIRESWGKTQQLKQNVTNAIRTANESRAMRQNVEQLLASNKDRIDETVKANQQILVKLETEMTSMKNEGLGQLNTMICDGKVRPCDPVCGGAGCSTDKGVIHCGGPTTCDNGALNKAHKALELVKETQILLESKQDQARTILNNVEKAEGGSKQSLEISEKAYDKAWQALNSSQSLIDQLALVKNETESFIMNKNITPQYVENMAKEILAMNISLTPRDINSLAGEINRTIASLTQIDRILADTQRDVDEARDLNAKAAKANEHANTILAMAQNVKQDLNASKLAMDRATTLLANITAHIAETSQKIDAISKDMDPSQKTLEHSVSRIEELKQRLKMAKALITKTGLNVNSAGKQSAQADALNAQARKALIQLKMQYKVASDKVADEMKEDNELAAQAHALKLKAQALTQNTLAKLKAIKDIESNLIDQDAKYKNLTAEVAHLTGLMRTYLPQINDKAVMYRTCNP